MTLEQGTFSGVDTKIESSLLAAGDEGGRMAEVRARVESLSQHESSYGEISAAAAALERSFQQAETTDRQVLRFYVAMAGTIDRARESFFKQLPQSEKERLDENYPHRGKLFRSICHVQCQALANIPPEDLSPEEKETYIRAMVRAHGVHYDGYCKGSYCFGFPRLCFEKPPHRKILEAVIEDRERVLTEEEMATVYRADTETYKLHLNVPSERKVEVLQAILAVQEEDNRIAQGILREKGEAGEQAVATRQEMRQRGGRLTGLSQYKMSGFEIDNPLVADFVFYPTPVSGQTKEEALIELAHELNEVLAELNLPDASRIPRFSAPVETGGQVVPGLTYVQGNGDLKAHLLVKYGVEKLNQYYDPDRNWAVRKGEEVDFG